MIAEFYDLDMNKIDTKGLITTNLEIPSIPFTNNWLGGVDGILPIHVGTDLAQRQILASLELISFDYLDYNLLRDHLYKTFGFYKPFYIIDKREPYKRFRVILESNYTPIRHGWNNGSVIIPFITEELPFAESIGTTLDIETNSVDAEGGLWGYGMGLLADDESLKYIHTTRTFRIYNAGVSVHPFFQELMIKINNVSEAFELINLTNLSKFQVTENVSGEVILNGPNITINGINALRRTNRKFIELSPGWNEFEITTDARVEFDFRFYYE